MEKELNEIRELLLELGESPEVFMHTNQEQFFNQNIYDIVSSGEAELVLKWLKVRAGKTPGEAF